MEVGWSQDKSLYLQTPNLTWPDYTGSWTKVVTLAWEQALIPVAS